jgi:imidazolonepropionase-like amidohydrolase
MAGWRFEGVLLPEGHDGELVVGSGELTALPGSFAVTGLVDAHCHVTVDVDARGLPFVSDRTFADARMEDLARHGVGLVRDVGGASEITLDYARGTHRGLPTVVAAGRFHSTRDRYFPRMYTPCDPDELAASIRSEVARGATWVKIITDFPLVVDGVPAGEKDATYDDDALLEAVRTAHELGARVAAHSTIPATRLVAMGVDSIEHGNGLTEDDLVALGARGGAWTPTIGAVVAAADHLPPERLPHVEAMREHYRHHLPVALRAGVTVMAGSDSAVPVARDIALLAEHGLTPLQALEAATVAARAYLGIDGSEDLVTFDDDPRDDLTVLGTPRAVVLGGERVL